MKKKAGAPSTIVRLRADNGDVHRLRVTHPRKVFGRWVVTQETPRKLQNSANVVCGLDRRIKILWKKNSPDQGAFIGALDWVLRKLGKTAGKTARDACWGGRMEGHAVKEPKGSATYRTSPASGGRIHVGRVRKPAKRKRAA
jgi:hypothetical protein